MRHVFSGSGWGTWVDAFVRSHQAAPSKWMRCIVGKYSSVKLIYKEKRVDMCVATLLQGYLCPCFLPHPTGSSPPNLLCFPANAHPTYRSSLSASFWNEISLI